MPNPYDISSLLEGVDDVDRELGEVCEKSVMTKDSLEEPTKKKTGTKTKKGGKKATSTKNKTSSLSGDSNSLSLKGGPSPMSLGAALEKVAGPSLKQKDYGRGLDDNDTFCGLGTVGEKEMEKSPFYNKSSSSSSDNKQGSGSKVKTVKRSQISPPKKQQLATAAMSGNPFGRSNYDDETENEEDLFETTFDNNPFKMPSYLG